MIYKYFSMENDRNLFVCQETGEQGIDPNFVTALDELREACGFPFVILSGYRSPRHSIEADKDHPGEHTRGAADVRCTNSHKRYLIIKHAMRLGFTGVGVNKDYVHVDKRTTTPRTWPY